jgi:general stress protein YciG
MSKKKSSDYETHKAAQRLGHLGGERGGPARADKLGKERRVEIAREGGKARQRKS